MRRAVELEFHGPETGPTIVVVPPLGGSSELFAPFRDQLAESHRVVTCEPPGMGDLEAAWPLATTRALARSALAALVTVGVKRAALFGISLGGMIAQWMAIEDHEERFDQLILASTAARGVSADVRPRRALAFARALATRDPHRAVTMMMSARASSDQTLRERIVRATSHHHHTRAELVRLAIGAALHDTRKELAVLAVPSLVISGSRDRIFSVEVQRSFASAFSAEHVVLDGAGHDVTLDAPREVASAILGFIGR